jgi:hypothetical protein
MPTTETKPASNPKWWDSSFDSKWDRVKAAFQRDWDQTKHHFGGKTPDTDQNVSDTVKQASGKEPIPPRGVPGYDKAERAYRLGYGARTHYGSRYTTWDDRLEAELERDWRDIAPEDRDDWPRYRSVVRRGWDYDTRTGA